MEELILSDRRENVPLLSYLYNVLLADVIAMGGRGEMSFSGERASIGLSLPSCEAAAPLVASAVAETICIGYKYRFLQRRLRVSLARRERRLLAAALIAADLEGDAAYVRRKIVPFGACAIDGVYAFRLGALREKWEHIAAYVPAGFSSRDLVKFCAFLAGESRNKIYLKGNAVFGANFDRLRRSRLTGEEDPETEIVLSDAGFIYCLGEVSDPLGDFLQKYYAERAIFS